MNTSVVQHLTHEHELIRSVLRAFSSFLGSPEAETPGAPAEAAMLLTYFEELLFLRHEEKEEVVLLPELARSGMHWGEGALLYVREEHQQGRHFLTSLKHLVRSASAWSPLQLERCRRAAREWTEFLLEHMDREEAGVFPVALERGPGSERWLEDFLRIDREIAELRDSAMLELWARDFLARYATDGVPASGDYSESGVVAAE